MANNLTFYSKHLCMLLIFLISHLDTINSWQYKWTPNSYSSVQDGDKSIQIFSGLQEANDNFKVINAKDNWMLVGARNKIYNISLVDLQLLEEIEWISDSMSYCIGLKKTQQECQNYIRVIVQTNPTDLFICGTNAFRPLCRTYSKKAGGRYIQVPGKEESGIAKCPFDPKQNSTSIYTDGKLFTATTADVLSRDALIIESKQFVRTEQYESKWLNEPNFVSSFEKDDKIYFFFRENAIENINCGKATFSRVARICKHDQGGNLILNSKWTSFFKARLNCSISGDFPFYFNEIQATTELGQGNYRPVPDSGDRRSMVYGVFTTGENSIPGSAICAFSHEDILRTFEGKFKGQKSALHNWLPVPDENVPYPYPNKCSNDSIKTPDKNLDFIQTHPLMDGAVPSKGGAPILVQTSFTSRFTQIAVDWQVLSAHERYYDIIFVGTDDGRVIKAINKGEISKIETVIIEDIQVFADRSPIINMKLYKGSSHILEKLVVMSERDIISIPLHRCHEKKSCHACVGLQDPYCSWMENKCTNSERGFQNIQEGRDDNCGVLPPNGISKPTTTTPRNFIPRKETCNCKVSSEKPDIAKYPNTIPDNTVSNNHNVYPNIPEENNNIIEGARYDEVRNKVGGEVTASTFAIALVISIVLSLVSGFLIGYKVSACRGSRDIETPYLDRNIAIQKSKNRLSSTGENVYCNPDHATLQKQLNYVVNVTNQGKLNSSVETKPVSKSNKVYL